MREDQCERKYFNAASLKHFFYYYLNIFTGKVGPKSYSAHRHGSRQREKQLQKALTHTKGEKMKEGADRWNAHYY